MVGGTLPKVVWNSRAAASLREIYEWIRMDSPNNANLVREGIIEVINGLPNNPQKFPPDKFKKNNSGDYRAFEKFSYRVAYRFSSQEIRVLRIRHVKQEPKGY